jgi:iron-sulfur cluster assembly accessory protein
MNYSPPAEVGKLDEVVEEKGVRVIIDSKALMFIVGTEMDYIDNEIKSEFVFNNPNAKGSCGCGESFNV